MYMISCSMADSAGDPIACQYCGSDIQVPADSSRFQAAVSHFETEHVGGPEAATGSSGRSAASCPTTNPDSERTEEPGASD